MQLLPLNNNGRRIVMIFVWSNPHHHARNVAPGLIAVDFSGMVRDNLELNKRVADMMALGRAGLPDGVGS
jgi:hypothetical protein